MARGIFYRDIPHYYGDFIRVLFLLTAGLFAIAIPLVGELLPFGLLAQVVLIVILVLLAALTHPHGRFIMWFNVAVAGLSAILLEYAAVALYEFDPAELFWVRELAALMLFVAFYFGVKTIRAMVRHRIGREEEVGEFESE